MKIENGSELKQNYCATKRIKVIIVIIITIMVLIPAVGVGVSAMSWDLQL